MFRKLSRIGFAGVFLALISAPSYAAGPGKPVAEKPLPLGDIAHGEELYMECSGCHCLRENKIGPRHCGLIGRKAGSVSDYTYSEVMRESGIVWTPRALDKFLNSPLNELPGTMMGFEGMYNRQDRADLIAYLQKAAIDPANCAPDVPASQQQATP